MHTLVELIRDVDYELTYCNNYDEDGEFTSYSPFSARYITVEIRDRIKELESRLTANTYSPLQAIRARFEVRMLQELQSCVEDIELETKELSKEKE